MFEFQIVGAENAASNMAQIGHRAVDAKPVLALVRDLLIAGHAEAFATQGASFGEPWPALSPETLERGGRQPLERTGALKRSLEGGAGRKTSVAKRSVSVGTSLWYGRFAQAGTSRGEPRRAIVGIGSADAEKILTMLQAFIMYGRGV